MIARIDVKRFIDVSVSLAAAFVLIVPGILIAILVKLTSSGPVLYVSDRIGRDNQYFRMPKFRTMRVDTPSLASHLLENPGQYLTPIGHFLRRSSLDELPQIWCVLVGEMSLVGPRPALYNQYDLIAERQAHGIELLRPGVTGWAQVNGRDELSLSEKVNLDVVYLSKKSIMFDFYIIVLTLGKVFKQTGISH